MAWLSAGRSARAISRRPAELRAGVGTCMGEADLRRDEPAAPALVSPRPAPAREWPGFQVLAAPAARDRNVYLSLRSVWRSAQRAALAACRRPAHRHATRPMGQAWRRVGHR